MLALLLVPTALSLPIANAYDAVGSSPEAAATPTVEVGVQSADLLGQPAPDDPAGSLEGQDGTLGGAQQWIADGLVEVSGALADGVRAVMAIDPSAVATQAQDTLAQVGLPDPAPEQPGLIPALDAGGEPGQPEPAGGQLGPSRDQRGHQDGGEQGDGALDPAQQWMADGLVTVSGALAGGVRIVEEIDPSVLVTQAQEPREPASPALVAEPAAPAEAVSRERLKRDALNKFLGILANFYRSQDPNDPGVPPSQP